jgi:hypothetical protein
MTSGQTTQPEQPSSRLRKPKTRRASGRPAIATSILVFLLAFVQFELGRQNEKFAIETQAEQEPCIFVCSKVLILYNSPQL